MKWHLLSPFMWILEPGTREKLYDIFRVEPCKFNTRVLNKSLLLSLTCFWVEQFGFHFPPSLLGKLSEGSKLSTPNTTAWWNRYTPESRWTWRNPLSFEATPQSSDAARHFPLCDLCFLSCAFCHTVLFGYFTLQFKL